MTSTSRWRGPSSKSQSTICCQVPRPGRPSTTLKPFEVPINELVQGQKRIVGSLYGSANPLIDLPRIFGLYRSGRLPLDDLIGERFALEAVNEAYATLTAGGVGRSVVVP